MIYLIRCTKVVSTILNVLQASLLLKKCYALCISLAIIIVASSFTDFIFSVNRSNSGRGGAGSIMSKLLKKKPEVILYYLPGSLCSQKVKLALIEASVDFTGT